MPFVCIRSFQGKKYQPFQKNDNDVRFVGSGLSLVIIFQMQFSKTNQDGFDFIVKIEKLKKQIENSAEYLDLEKCSSKLAKIHEKVSAIAEKKKRREIRELIVDAQQLIALKTKKFKRRIIEQIAQGSREAEGNSKDKTLKYSKSMENFEFAKLPTPKVRVKNEEEDLWQDRTQVHQPRNNTLKLEKRVEQLEDQISQYRKKITKIEEAKSTANLSQLCYRLGEQQGLFEQQLNFKIREKSLQIDELKEKLRRSEEKNQQLKNRLLNEQKRQDDYIQNLKNHINNMAGELQSAGRENKKLQEEINKIYYVCDGYKLEVKKLMDEVEHLHRQKKRSQQNELLKMKDNGLKRQLEALEMQEKYMRDMESMLQSEKDEKNVLLQQTEQLQKRNASLQHQHIEMRAENERLEQMLEIKVEEITELKKQMLRYLDHKNKCENELMNAQAVILKLQTQIQGNKQRKAIELQKKADNLRQIKSLLQLK